MGWTSPEARELFNLVARQQAEERRTRTKQLSDVVKSLPISQETLDQLCTLSPEDFERVMRHHPAYKTQRNLESIQTMLAVFHQAMVDLRTAVSDFPDSSTPDAKKEQEASEIRTSVRVNKELLAAVSASQSLVDYSRRVKVLLPAGVFDERRILSFDEGQHALVKDLRNLLLHRLHTAASWSTVYSRRGHNTYFKIETEDLLAEGDLSVPARKHLASIGKIVDVSELLANYATQVDQFYRWYIPELEQNLPDSVKDYRRCREVVKRHHGQQSYQLMLGLWLQANVDPYAHLHKFLTTDQLSAALEMPRHSSAQVDYIISCVDRTGLCNEELGRLAYQLFEVDSRVEAV